VRDLGTLSLDEVKEVFQRINSTSYSLNAMETANARFDGEFKAFGEWFSSLDLFNIYRVFTQTDVKRMNDVRLCLTIAISILSNYFNRDDDIEGFLREYNDEFPERVFLEERVSAVVNFMINLGLSNKSRIWKKSDFLTCFVEFDRHFNAGGTIISEEFTRIFVLVDQLDTNNVERSPAFRDLSHALPTITAEDWENYFEHLRKLQTIGAVGRGEEKRLGKFSRMSSRSY
jgi:hypothetical protein